MLDEFGVEFLVGEEASFFALCDGESAIPLASAQDHKRVFDGDQGPNTGGMGAYSPAPVVTPEMHARIMREIILPTVNGMAADGIPLVDLATIDWSGSKSGPASLILSPGIPHSFPREHPIVGLAKRAGCERAFLVERAEARLRYTRAAEALTTLGDDRFLGITLGNLALLDASSLFSSWPITSAICP